MPNQEDSKHGRPQKDENRDSPAIQQVEDENGGTAAAAFRAGDAAPHSPAAKPGPASTGGSESPTQPGTARGA